MSTLKSKITGMPVKQVDEVETNLSLEEQASLKEEVSAVIADLDNEAVRRELIEFGTEFNQNSGKSYNLLKGKIKNILSDSEEKKQIEDGMHRMRMAIENIHPDKLSKLTFWEKLFGKNKLTRQTEKMLIGYETAEKQIETIGKALTDGVSYLKSDSEEMIRMWDDIACQQKELDRLIFMNKELVKEIDEKANSATGNEKNKLITLGSMMKTKLQDMMIMKEANQQFQTSIDMTVNNNQALCMTIERTKNITLSLTRTALALQGALSKQKDIANAARESQNYASDLLLSNANAVGANTKEVRDLYSGPVLNMDKLREAHQKIIDSANEMQDLRLQSNQVAEKVISELESFSKPIESRINAIGME